MVNKDIVTFQNLYCLTSTWIKELNQDFYFYQGNFFHMCCIRAECFHTHLAAFIQHLKREMSYHWWDRVPKLRLYPVPPCPPTWGWRHASDLSLRQPRMTREDVDHDNDVRGPFFVFDRVALACQNTSFHGGEESGIPAKPEVSQVLVRTERWLPEWNWSGLHPSQQDRSFVCGRGRGTQPRATHKGGKVPVKPGVGWLISRTRVFSSSHLTVWRHITHQFSF